MSIELYYFEGCPSFSQALENLTEAMRLEGLSDPVDMVKVGSEDEAQANRLIGSPTIRINGVDIEGVEAEAGGYGLGCRIYSDGERTAGHPSVGPIRQALRRLGSER